VEQAGILLRRATDATLAARALIRIMEDADGNDAFYLALNLVPIGHRRGRAGVRHGFANVGAAAIRAKPFEEPS